MLKTNFDYKYIPIIIFLLILPVIIQFLIKKKSKKVNFGTLYIIKLAYQNARKKMLLKEWLLLFLRVSVIGMIVLLVLNPQWYRSDKVVSASNEIPLIVLDNSASMQGLVDNGSKFVLAKKKAAKIIEEYPSNKEFLLYVCGSAEYYMGNKNKILKKLSSISVSFFSQNINECIVNADDIAKQKWNFPRKMYLISDFQKSVFVNDFKLADSQIEIHYLKIDSPNENIAINEVKSSMDFEEQLRVVKVVGSLRNYGDSDNEITVQVFDNKGKVLSRSGGGIKSFSTIRKSLAFPYDNPNLFGRFKIMKKDSLLFDNIFYFFRQVGIKMDILLVEGDPEPIPSSGGAYFLHKILSIWDKQDSFLKVKLINLSELNRLDFSGYSTIILENISNINNETVEKLVLWVKNGGKLLAVLGDKTDKNFFNSAFSNISPAKIRGLVNGRVTESYNISTDNIKIKVDNSLKERLRLVKIWGYINFSDLSNNTQTLIKLNNGAPLLISKNVGKGKFAVWGTTVDLKWSDLPYKTSFLPIFYRILKNLEGKSQVNFKKDYFPGDGVVFKYKKSKLKIEKPDGKIVVVKGVKDGKEYRFNFTETDIPGIYKVRDEKLVTQLFFTVNVNPLESEIDSYNFSNKNISETGSYFVKNKVDFSWLIILLIALLLLSEGVVHRWL